MNAPRPSLHARLVWQVVGPLVLTWAAGMAAALWLATDYVQRAYDRALLDNAYAVAAQVVRRQGQVAFDLTEQELQILLFDQSESVYFSLQTPEGRFIAGHSGLVAESPDDAASPRFGRSQLHGRSVRTVTLRRDGEPPFLIVMGQTTESLQRQLRLLVFYSVALQLTLLALLAWWLRRAIGRQMQPLAQLQQAVDERDAADLAALPPALSAEADTRDMQRLGVAINSLLERLSHSLAAQREFTGNVAHELRTPLAGIGAQAEYALAQSDPAVWREQLEGILKSQARSSHYVAQLLALARADEAQSALQLRPLALGPLVREVVLQWLPRADAQGVDLGAQGLDAEAWVLGDAILIEGLLNNLLDNALRHGSSAAAPSVTVALRKAGHHIELRVFDNGPGIDAAERARLQQRGTQAHAGADSGVGLGLAIVRRYATLMQADFALLDNPQGHGLLAVTHFRHATASPGRVIERNKA
ncbi:MAG: sensor histidine kinase [Burkholderiaceae bacterium]|jgi:two-component system sensor histidine kinase TctE|nr:sensor histidine kinase [Burkholderiaceae bacterium]